MVSEMMAVEKKRIDLVRSIEDAVQTHQWNTPSKVEALLDEAIVLRMHKTDLQVEYTPGIIVRLPERIIDLCKIYSVKYE